MRKITLLLLILLVGTLGFASKKKKYAKENDETNVSVWWEAKKYKTSKKYYRDHGNGVSNIQSVAESKAMLEAKANLTKQIKSAVAVVETSSVKDVNGQATTNFTQFEKLVAEQSLSNVKVVTQTIGKKSDNSIDYNVVVQISKEEIKKSVLSEMDKERLGLTPAQKQSIISKIDSDGADNTEGD